MANLFFNKKGGEKLLSVWWFFVLTIVAVGIVVGVLMFYSSEVDFRKIQADTLTERVSSCLIKNGHFDNSFFQDDFDIFAKCYLNEKILERGNYYGRIFVEDINNPDFFKEVVFGPDEIYSDCLIQFNDSNLVAEGFPVCNKQQEVSSILFEGDFLELNVDFVFGLKSVGERKIR